MKFSVLMSIYYKEKTEYFNRAMQSIWDEQSVKPSEIVLVQDGPLNDELYESISNWQDKLGGVFKTVALEQNVGLGDALNIGMNNCSNELISRMDTDDIALKGRFEKQLKVFENSDTDVCSSWVSEFEDDENKIVSYRKLPELHKDISKFFKIRNAINHPAVMYKKSVVQEAGGYKKMMWFEDYFLWARMILNGAKFYNIQEPLVKMRAGHSQLKRRSGLNYAKYESQFLYEIYKLNFLTLYELVFNLFFKIPIRIVPKVLVSYVYKILRK